MNKTIILLASGLLFSLTTRAQDSTEKDKSYILDLGKIKKQENTGTPGDTSTIIENSKTSISLGTGGLKVGKNISGEGRRKVSLHFLMLDLGINALNDRTDYASPGAKSYLQVSPDKQNGNLFSLRPAKSINVNIWPVLANFNLFTSNFQKISLYTGAGMQLYNFRFNKRITYLNETNPMIIEDSVSFSKNKLAFAYVSIPLMLNFQTRIAGKTWLTYGFGLIGGYAFDIWTKQISDERGKQKNHDQFNFNRFNLNLSGEIGIKNIIRFYGTYQVTNMYENSLVQNPYCIGIRFFGI